MDKMESVADLREALQQVKRIKGVEIYEYLDQPVLIVVIQLTLVGKLKSIISSRYKKYKYDTAFNLCSRNIPTGIEWLLINEL